jgi:hypothetical protein
MEKPDNQNIIPVVDVIDSILRYFRCNSDPALVKDIVRVNEPMFQELYESFQTFKEIGAASEQSSVKTLERQIDQLCHALALFGVNKRFGSVINLNPQMPEFTHLLDSAYHLSNLIWSASKQSSDEGFATMYGRVAQEEANREFFSTLRACVPAAMD